MIQQSILLISALLLLSACQTEGTNANENQKATVAWSDSVEQALMVKGKSMATASFQALSSRLQKTMMSEGPVGAVKYCHTAAYPLTDSLAHVHQSVIRRSSHRVRNPKNSPTSIEKEIIDTYLSAMESGESPLPLVRPLGQDSAHFFAPIILKPACLACHGEPGIALSSELNEHIQSLYPNDQATGFREGELRGIWSIRMKR